MEEKEIEYCSNVLTRFGEMIDVESLQRISQMTSAPSIVYGHLYSHPEGASPKDLVRECGCMPSRITAILNGLEKNGCIERFEKNGDHRRVYVRLTDAGRKNFEVYFNKLLTVVKALKDHFGKEKMEGFLADMKDAITFLKDKGVYEC